MAGPSSPAPRRSDAGGTAGPGDPVTAGPVPSSSGVGLWTWDVPARSLYLQRDARRLLGLDADGAASPRADAAWVLAQLHDDDRPALVRALRRLLLDGQPMALRCRHLGAAAAGTWLACTGLLQLDERGRPWRVTGLVQQAPAGPAGGRAGAIASRYRPHDTPTRIGRRRRDALVPPRVPAGPAPDGVVAFAADGTVQEANEAFARMTGYALDELPGMALHEIDADLTPAQAQALLALDRVPAAWCRPVRCKDGRRITLEIVASRWERDGRPLTYCLCRDVTEREAVAEALRTSEARYRAAFDNSAVGIAEHALDGRWLSANPRMGEITGYDLESLMQLDYRHLSLSADLPEDFAQLRRLLSGELSTVRVEKRYLRRDGKTLWVARTSSVVRDAAGAPLRFLSIVEDITERKRIEAELALHRQQLEAQVDRRTAELRAALQARAESERFLRSLADNLPDMVGYWDAGRVLRFANRPYRAWYGRGREVLGMTRSALLGDPAGDAGEPLFAAALQGQAADAEYTLHDPHGAPRHVWVHYVPELQDGKVAGVFVLVADIAPIKQAELRLRTLNEQLVQARDRAEAANRAKTAFLANIGHEIRTPMNAIIGLTHLMRRDLGDELARERLGKVSDAAHHLLDVINDVLDFSKIEAGGLQLDRCDFPVEAVLARAAALLADRARHKGLQLTVDCADVPALLHGDPTRVSQALLNLAGNAVKFTEQGGVVLRCRPEPGPAGAPGDGGLRLRFSVEDTGVGVPADRLPQLFNAFEQADSSTTRRFGGTGLGLAITKRLAAMMGGEVGVHSEPGRGSCFWFTARFEPAHDDAPAAPRAPPGADPALPWARELALRERHRGARVLLAEDNPINQEVARELLDAVDLVVDVADDGQAAVRMAREQDYDLVLMDMQMPLLDGLGAARALRAMPRHARTPIVAMTASAFGDDRQACLDAGMNDHLAKPVSPATLYRVLGRWLSASRGPAVDAGTPPVAAAPVAPAGADFEDIPGLVMSSALMALPGHQSIYARVLRQFVTSYAGGLPELSAWVRQGRWLELGRGLHSLRGACAAVGAVDLSRRCEALESRVQALADGAADDDDAAQVAPGVAALRAALADLVTRVDRRLARHEGAAARPLPAGPVPMERLLPALDELAGLLRMADFKAAAQHRTIEPMLRQAFGDDGARSVELPLRAHDYDAALAALQALRAGLAPAGPGAAAQ